MTYAVSFEILFCLRQPFDRLKNRGTLLLLFLFAFALYDRKSEKNLIGKYQSDHRRL